MNKNNITISKGISIRDGIEKMDKGARKILLVEEEKRLVGVVTDGDIRRWILKNGDLSKPIEFIMNKTPITLTLKDKSKAMDIMKSKSVEGIPIIDENNHVVDMVFWDDLYCKKYNFSKDSNIPVVIMAGGRGSRLEPYTSILPKLLLPIGYIPIVDRIINNFLENGFNDFYLTLNYKKEIIKAYFHGELPYKIDFVEEERPLGTAGSLVLLEKNLSGSFFVTNCDILVDANYSKILNYHKENGYMITVVSSLKNYVIPYGIFKIGDNGEVLELKEKPNLEFLVNTGMYLVEKEALKYIPKGEYFDMTDLIESCISSGEGVGIYPVTENQWLDMGEFKEMANMMEKLKEEGV